MLIPVTNRKSERVNTQEEKFALLERLRRQKKVIVGSWYEVVYGDPVEEK